MISQTSSAMASEEACAVSDEEAVDKTKTTERPAEEADSNDEGLSGAEAADSNDEGLSGAEATMNAGETTVANANEKGPASEGADEQADVLNDEPTVRDDVEESEPAAEESPFDSDKEFDARTNEEKNTESGDDRTTRTPGISWVLTEHLAKLNGDITHADTTNENLALMLKNTFLLAFESNGVTPLQRCELNSGGKFFETADYVCAFGQEYKGKSGNTQLCRVWAQVIAIGACFMSLEDKGTTACLVMPRGGGANATFQLWLVRDIWGHTHTHTHTHAHNNTQ
jgi:hypothetical protein